MNNTNIENYILRTPQKHEKELFYSGSSQEAACIGHLRADFGSGNDFWTSWNPHAKNDLNDTTFKAEFGPMIHALRENDGPLSGRHQMETFCFLHEESMIVAADTYCPSVYGFVVETDGFSFYLRFAPAQGNYDLYVYCYVKQELHATFGRPDCEVDDNA